MKSILKNILRYKKSIIIFIVITTLFVATSCNFQCSELKKAGFSYKIDDGGLFSAWDIVTFYYLSPEGKSGLGPIIEGNQLRVKCDDVDGDGFSDFIIEGRVDGYRTILTIDQNTGTYHVQYTDGLKIAYPEEGYNYL